MKSKESIGRARQDGGKKETPVDNGGVCVALLPCKRYNSPPQNYICRMEVGVSGVARNYQDWYRTNCSVYRCDGVYKDSSNGFSVGVIQSMCISSMGNRNVVV